jgi:hypothetical protein
MQNDTFRVTLYRFGGERQVTGHMMGYAIISEVTVEKTLVLSADTIDQLTLMVAFAAVDGWHRRNGVKP